LPAISAISDFPELNFRTYVHRDGKPGIYFLSIHAGKRAAAKLATWFSPLPYVHAQMEHVSSKGKSQFRCFRSGAHGEEPIFWAQYSLRPPAVLAEVGSLDEWLLERYRLYVDSPCGNLCFTEVHHAPWTVQAVEVGIAANSLGQAFGLDLSRAPDCAHFSAGVRAIAWPFQRVDER
jgi:uncharacterized protein YqjF (DUF2071 family)